LIRTRTARPFDRLVTLTTEPSGITLEAAVISRAWKVSPEAVRRPSKPGPYQEATPTVEVRLIGGDGLVCATDAGGKVLYEPLKVDTHPDANTLSRNSGYTAIPRTGSDPVTKLVPLGRTVV
jgi:hypothetical protein